jgi:hypothetical protein
MSVTWAKTVETNKVCQNGEAEQSTINYIAEAAITPGALLSKGTTSGQVKMADSGGGLTALVGFAKENPYGIVASTGLPVDPVVTQFIATQAVPTCQHGLIKVLVTEAGGVVDGDFGMACATPGTVAKYVAAAGNIQCGQFKSAAATANYALFEVNIAGS